jgi:hypothetical protein
MTSHSHGRPVQLKVRISWAERKAYISASEDAGVRLSEWVRDACNDAIQQKR